MPRTACRVVCGLDEAIAILLPTRALVRVDLPALGRPTKQANPERNGCPSDAGSSARAVSSTAQGSSDRSQRDHGPHGPEPSTRQTTTPVPGRSPSTARSSADGSVVPDQRRGLQPGRPRRDGHRHGDLERRQRQVRQAPRSSPAYVRPSVSRTQAPCGRAGPGPGGAGQGDDLEVLGVASGVRGCRSRSRGARPASARSGSPRPPGPPRRPRPTPIRLAITVPIRFRRPAGRSATSSSPS